MATSDWMPGTRTGQLAMAKVWQAELLQNGTAWGVPSTVVTAFTPLVTAADTVLAEAETSERVPSLTARLNTAFHALTAAMREDIKKRYFYVPPLKEEDMVRLGLGLKDTTASHQGPPTAQVGITVVPVGPHLLQARFSRLPGGVHPAEGSEWGLALYEGIMPHGGATLEEAAGPNHYLREPPADGKGLQHRKFTRRKSETLAVCCASRMKLPKIACKAIFYLTNCVRVPNNRGFCDFFAKKSHKNLQAQQAPRLQREGKRQDGVLLRALREPERGCRALGSGNRSGHSVSRGWTGRLRFVRVYCGNSRIAVDIKAGRRPQTFGLNGCGTRRGSVQELVMRHLV